MKALLVIVGLVLAAGAGAVGGALFAPAVPPAPGHTLEPASLAAPAVPAISSEARARMDELSMEIAHLKTQIAALRSDSSRQPASSAATSAPELASATSLSTQAFVALHRDAIVQVLEDERAERARKQEEERRLREEQADQAKAERIGTKLNLSVGQKQLLTDFLVAERTKREEMRLAWRDGDGAVEPREAFREAQQWRTNELTRLFGTDLGAQIGEAERERDRRDVQQVRRGARPNGGGPQGPGANGGG